MPGPLPGTGGRPPLVGAKLVASPEYWKDPAKFTDRLTVEENLALVPLGPASPSIAMHPVTAAKWNTMVANLTWLRETDREIIEMLVMLLARIHEAWVFGGLADEKTFNTAARLLALVGATPTTRSRLLVQPKKDDPKKKGSKYGNSWS